MNFETEFPYRYVPDYYNRMTLKEKIIFKVLFDDPNCAIIEAVRDLNPGNLSEHQIATAIKIAELQDSFLEKLDRRYL